MFKRPWGHYGSCMYMYMYIILCSATCACPFNDAYNFEKIHSVGLQPPKPSWYLFPSLGDEIGKLILYLKH